MSRRMWQLVLDYTLPSRYANANQGLFQGTRGGENAGILTKWGTLVQMTKWRKQREVRGGRQQTS